MASLSIRKVSEIAHYSDADGSQPPDRYVFMLNVVDDSFFSDLTPQLHGADLRARESAPPGRRRARASYNPLLGSSATVLPHLEREALRPAEFASYDRPGKTTPSCCGSLKGLTSYYDDLFLRRADCWTTATYLKLITKTINQVLQTPDLLGANCRGQPASTPG